MCVCSFASLLGCLLLLNVHISNIHCAYEDPEKYMETSNLKKTHHSHVILLLCR